ncbi:uncharacterized protein LOC143376695 isoform X2 [Andrena cerasifolii]
MRMKLLKIVVILLLSGSGDARPQKTEGSSQPARSNTEEWKPVQATSTLQNTREDSSVQANDAQRQLKDLQYMDQSLRTVTTQLLNASSPEDPGKILDSNIIKKPIAIQKPVERNDITPMKELTVMNGQPIGFGRPINSKFSYFESSHPGQAMAITEEELEREMSSTRLMTAYKNHPTTTGGISTWILLNPPSTTIKTIEMEKRTKPPPETEVRVTVKPTTLMERVETTERVAEKVTMPVSTTMEEAPSTRRTVLVTTKKTTDSKPEKVEGLEKLEPVLQNTTFKLAQTTVSMLESKEAFAGTTKKVQILRTTPKPKTATSKTTLLSKPSVSKTSRPNHLARPKPPIRRTTVKPDIAKNENASIAKIEKVTFRPVQMVTISKNKPESTEKPMFVTKIKASIMMGTQKTTTPTPSSPTTNVDATTTTKSIFNNELTEVKTKPVATKASNVLKMQLKKPLDDATNIEIESIKVNAPVLKIEKVEEKDSLDSSKIDLKFDFNRELTKVNVDTEESVSTTSATTPTSTSTTKRPRHTSKRKKNKVRRRKPSTSTTTTTVAPVTASSTGLELLAEESIAENDVQESKIAPETKLTANSTKMKKKPPQKPISTQIYNFLSREVMPSFGVMSLVGLGLGLASYFLYPFGGAIARRNYEVEPKYKYNLDEYGGNYGQSEEEVLSKVLQGMTSDEVNYAGNKDYDSNYYRYQNHDGGYESQMTKKNEQRYPSSSPIYTAPSFKYKNTDHRYADAPSTPNYYDRPKPSAYVVGQSVPGSANRQFVVGNVPKDYPPYEEKVPALSTPGKLANSYEPTESGQAQFDHDAGQSFSLPGGAVQGSAQGYGQIQTARPEEGYEEVEITPAAVAVEHGPRYLRTKRSVDSMGPLAMKPSYLRWKRDSVIQVIPSKRELEEDEKEENLSNEILNIIDSALPGEDGEKTKDRRKDNEVEDFEAQRRRQKEEEKTRLKEATMKSPTAETTTASTTFSTASSSTEPASSSTKGVTDPVASPAATEVEGNTTESSKDTEESNVEWTDPTTGKPPEQNGFNLFNFVKKIAEIKFRLGLTILKHASEGFARYIGHVQKRINGEE